MSKYRIYLSPPHQNGFEKEHIESALNSNWLAPVGPQLDLFEDKLAALHENHSVLALNSGTAAIHLALIMAGVGYGDEVVAATHTHNATVNPIIYVGAKPILVDCERDTWNISPIFLRESIEDRLKKGKKPKAIVLVHLYGMPANMNEILSIANEFDIPIIEDAAESLGAKYDKRPLGVYGQYGILSFNGNKIVTTSGGGALILNNADSRRRALFLATQARDDAPHFQHSEIGFNYRLSNILASLGLAQLIDLESKVAKRRATFNKYAKAFNSLNSRLDRKIVTYTQESELSFSNRWLSTFLIEPYNNVSSETWRLKLAENGIESRPLWKPMHLQPVFRDFPFYGNETSNRIFEQGICLPSGYDITNSQIEEITGIIISLYK